MKKDYQMLLAEAIFNKPYENLDDMQKIFVDYHFYEWRKYQKEAAAALRKAMNKKRLNDHDYERILQYYRDRIRINDIILGIEDGMAEARRRKTIVYASGWFDSHIRKRHEVSKSRVIDHIIGRVPIEPDFPWFYRLFRTAQQQKIIVFDPWLGYQYQLK